jgi:hypothetical protein
MDFAYIKKRFDCDKPVKVAIRKNQSDEVKFLESNVNVLSLIPSITGQKNPRFHENLINTTVSKALCFQGKIMEREGYQIEVVLNAQIGDELLTFGLIEKEKNEKHVQEDSRLSSFLFRFQEDYHYVYTPKMERFKYWLAYNGFFPPEIQIDLES